MEDSNEEKTKSSDNNIILVNLLNEYFTQQNDKFWSVIENNDILTFKSILTQNSHSFSMEMIIRRIIQSHLKFHIDTSAFLQFIIVNDDKLKHNVQDYSLIIAYCTETSDFETLKLIIDTIDKSKYDLTTLFTDWQLWGPHADGLIDNIDPRAYVYSISPLFLKNNDSYGYNNDYAVEPKDDSKYKWSILDSCVASDSRNENEYNRKTNSRHDHSMNLIIADLDENRRNMDIESGNQDTNINKKENADDEDYNYKCFEYLATKTGIIAGLITDNKKRNRFIYDCFDNVKPNFVECMIKHNLLNDYTVVLLNISKMPQTSKLKAMTMLLYDYTYKERYFDIFAFEDNEYIFRAQHQGKTLNVDSNCLTWLLNIGLGNGDIMIKQANLDEMADSVDAAFECFKLILECRTCKANEINKLVNERMEDRIHIAELCASMGNRYPKYINYLIENNGKYDWKIDFEKTNMLQLLVFVGDYRTFQAVIRNYVNPNTGGCNIYDFGFGYCPWVSNSSVNKFNSLQFYKLKLNYTRKYNKDNLSNLMQNLFFWCVNTTKTIFSSKRVGIMLNSNLYIEKGDEVTHLTFSELKFLCNGYLRNCGYEYPDNLASVVLKFFDWGYGNIQCFKYLLDNYRCSDCKDEMKDENNCNVSLYPTMIEDCIKHCRIDLMKILFNKWKGNNHKLYSSDGKSFCQLVKSAFHMACFSCNSEMVKLLLEILSGDSDYNLTSKGKDYFNINEICEVSTFAEFKSLQSEPSYITRFIMMNGYNNNNNNNNQVGCKQCESTSTTWPPSKSGTPLMFIVQSSIKKICDGGEERNKSVFGDIDYLIDDYQEHKPRECVELLLSQPNIDIHKSYDGETAFSLAVDRGEIDLAQCLINHWNDSSANGIRDENGIKNEMGCLDIAVKNKIQKC